MRVLRDVLDKREEFATVLNDDHDPLAALKLRRPFFHGRTATQEAAAHHDRADIWRGRPLHQGISTK